MKAVSIYYYILTIKHYITRYFQRFPCESSNIVKDLSLGNDIFSNVLEIMNNLTALK